MSPFPDAPNGRRDTRSLAASNMGGWPTSDLGTYFLMVGSTFAFICASSLFNFSIADLSAAISAWAAASARPEATNLGLRLTR